MFESSIAGFGQGESSKTITIKIGNGMEIGVLSDDSVIDPAYTQAYTVRILSRLELNICKRRLRALC